jgi:hypothetical protein
MIYFIANKILKQILCVLCGKKIQLDVVAD